MRRGATGDGATGRWLLLIHQLPPEPAYLRVKVRRRLQRMGAQLLKNSVYVLPNRPDTVEDFHWLRREILDAGGEATVTVAEFLEGVTDGELEAQFRLASEEEYSELIDAVRGADTPLSDRDLRRLRTQLHDVAARDFFEAEARDEAERILARAAGRGAVAAAEVGPDGAGRPDGATWVTRRGVHIDRMASAWLIRRFIDPAARFEFVPSRGYRPEAGELRFDMYEGEFTHGEDRCTFQTLLTHFGLADPALGAIGEIIHDIDCKVHPFRREEAEGVRAMVHGICLAHEGDEDRIAAGASLWEGLHAHFSGG